MSTRSKGSETTRLEENQTSTFIESILIDRGYDTAEKRNEFLHPRYEKLPDPFLFRDMKKAVEAIKDAIDAKRQILIHGDYDIDGISAAVILARTIINAGGKVDLFFPDRQKDGYGLRMKTVSQCHKKGIGLVITCDCGIRNTSEIAALGDFGIQTIVTDHHDFTDDLPTATAILHPRIPGESFPGKLLSGAGVAWMLAAALYRSKISGLNEGQEKWLLDLAMLGTIGDMVPLLGENRIITTFGLRVLSQSRWPGLVLLAGEKPSVSALTSEDVSFQIIPKLNAAGRIADARIAADLLLSTTAAAAMPLLDQLREINFERQRITHEMSSYGLEHISSLDPFVLMGQDHWPIGVVGLVANRLMETTKKPVLLYGRREADGHLVGSARSPSTIHITEVLTECKDILIEYGGHAQAAGFTVTETNLITFRERLHMLISDRTSRAVPAEKPSAYPLSISECSLSMYSDIQQLQPFGIGNAEPLFLLSVVLTNLKRVGGTGSHLKVRLIDPITKVSIDAIGFNLASQGELPKEGTEARVIVALRDNVWNGEHMVQCHLRSIDIR